MRALEVNCSCRVDARAAALSFFMLPWISISTCSPERKRGINASKFSTVISVLEVENGWLVGELGYSVYVLVLSQFIW